MFNYPTPMHNPVVSNKENEAILASEKINKALELLGKGKKTVREMRALIFGLEEVMKELPGALYADDFQTKHHFDDGIYMRELFIPRGTVLTGKIHSHGHLNLLVKGTITVWTEDGMKTLSAPFTLKSKPGIKRVGYAHEDAIWITVHHNPTNERDIKKVEKRLFSETFEGAYFESEKTFEDAIAFIGMPEDEVRAISENELDQIPFESDSVKADVRDSSVHGQGLFAKDNFNPGEIIAPARVNGMRTPAGRFTNHSGTPNAKMVLQKNGDIHLVAISEIKKDSEIFNDYFFSFIELQKTQEVVLCRA